MYYFLLIALVIWIYVLTIFKRGKLHFALFAVGSIGLFLTLMFFVGPYLRGIMQMTVAKITSDIGSLMKITDTYVGSNMILVHHQLDTIGLLVDFECSGVIEVLAFISLICFFPVYRTWEKIITNVVGVIAIVCINVLRVLMIAFLLNEFGNSMYYVAHSILGRIVFYFLSMMLYFYAFTRPQILRQRIGSFHYEVD